MIHLHCNTENGEIEAEFKTLDELYKFQDSLRKNKEKREREAIEKRELEIKNQRNAEEQRYADFKKKNDEIKSELTATLVKAHRYGIEPERVVDLITRALEGLVESTK